MHVKIKPGRQVQRLLGETKKPPGGVCSGTLVQPFASLQMPGADDSDDELAMELMQDYMHGVPGHD